MNSRILVVEDDVDLAVTLADILESEGYEVQTAHSAEDALELASETHFDVTLMDIRLPGMNGVDALRELRRMQPDARVILMTAYAVPELLEQGRREGAVRVVEKPFDFSALVEQIEEVRPRLVLLVDDDVDFTSSIRQVLEVSGYRVEIAGTGERALELLEKNSADVLLLDIRLPKLSGLEVYGELERRGTYLPTLVTTAFADEEADALRALKARGVATTLLKPFSPGDLIRQIELLARPPDGASD